MIPTQGFPAARTRVNAADERLAQVKARPALVEHAVRVALRDAITWRIGGGSAPSVAVFVGAAIAAARPALDASDADAAERTRTLTAVQRAAKRFITSPLGCRLMRVSPSKLSQSPSLSDGAQVIVRDRSHRLHAIVLTARPGTFDAGQAATLAAHGASLTSADRLAPLTVHVFSLATGKRRTFQRNLTTPQARRARAA